MTASIFSAVKLTFNVEVVAGNTAHFQLPQVILHTKLCKGKSNAITALHLTDGKILVQV